MDYYGEIADGYDELYQDEQINKLNIIRDNIPVSKHKTLLDVGCGSGFSLRYFECKCIGLEPSDLGHRSSAVIRGYAENIPFSDNYFDIVISVTAVHNFDDIAQGLNEIKRVGKEWFAITILKRSKKYKKIITLIKKMFQVMNEIDEKKDTIFILKKSSDSNP